MSDSYDEDSDAKDTQVLAAEKAPSDLEGTVEMDRESLFRRLQADSQSGPPDDGPDTLDGASTQKLERVEGTTEPSKTVQMEAVDASSTKAFAVPDDVMEKLRKDDLKQYQTLDIPLEAIDASKPPQQPSRPDRTTMPMNESDLTEFASVIDENGRIPIPAAKLVGNFRPGKRVVVVMRIIED